MNGKCMECGKEFAADDITFYCDACIKKIISSKINFCVNCKYHITNTDYYGTNVYHKCVSDAQKIDYVNGILMTTFCDEINIDGKCKYYKQKDGEIVHL